MTRDQAIELVTQIFLGDEYNAAPTVANHNGTLRVVLFDGTKVEVVVTMGHWPANPEI